MGAGLGDWLCAQVAGDRVVTVYFFLPDSSLKLAHGDSQKSWMCKERARRAKWLRLGLRCWPFKARRVGDAEAICLASSLGSIVGGLEIQPPLRTKTQQIGPSAS